MCPLSILEECHMLFEVLVEKLWRKATSNVSCVDCANVPSWSGALCRSQPYIWGLEIVLYSNLGLLYQLQWIVATLGWWLLLAFPSKTVERGISYSLSKASGLLQVL